MPTALLPLSLLHTAAPVLTHGLAAFVLFLLVCVLCGPFGRPFGGDS